MRPSTRLIAIVSAAVLLPVVIFGGVFSAFDSLSKRQLVEATALDKARRVTTASDAELSRSIASLRVLATSRTMRPGNWADAAARSAEVRDLNPDWKTVSLMNTRTGALVFSTAGTDAPLDHDTLRRLLPGRDVVIDGIARRPGRCICVIMAERVKPPLDDLALVVEIDPSRFQSLLLAEAPKGATAAIVDRQGRFIARSLDYANRVGTPATPHLREAIATGTTGFYAGTTWEGQKSYTGFVTSPLTGWSTHVAVSSALVIMPTHMWWLSLVVAGLAAILFAAGLTWYGLRTLEAQRASEDRLRAAERMEALGKLTGGIAHDFNNMLAVTIGNLQLAQRRAAMGGDVTRFIDTALDGAKRATELTQRMLAFSRRQALAPEILDPNTVLTGVIDLLERTIGEHIVLKSRVTGRPWPILADRGQLENALVNLAANARDAMPDGGPITFEIANLKQGEKAGGVGLPGDGVVIAVSDSGTGMAPEVVRRALEPFYTTKETGRGTGLGLSQVYGFVQQSGGDLAIESAPGKGTTVRLLLPRADAPADIAAEIVAVAARPLAPSSLDILLVEDDERVRRMTEASLIELGHRVRTAHNAVQALSEVDRGVPDLLLSDIVMPGMNGRRLADKVRADHPGVAILLVSAFEPEASEDISFPRLQKPFTLQSLEAAIARVMSRAA